MSKSSINPLELDDLYESYGFSKRESDNPLVRIYSFRSGPFHNADIVVLSKDVSGKKELDVYTKAGFSCSIRKYNSLHEVERALFEGFFDIEKTIKNIKVEYKNYAKKVIRNSNSEKYKYINCSYMVNESDTLGSQLIENIYDQLQFDTPKLILIEAAASYGKTCSAFEIMNYIAHRNPSQIPMLTELSRNRTARIFRYVLLDEINKSFPTLNYDLVKSHIHKKNVILIIDGFDELLHRNEKGKENFENVEPMLETIKELLYGKAKIILTTRKTAIFSGDEFHLWIDDHIEDFDIVRYEINQPTASDWLGFDKCNKLEECGFPVSHFSNPVLLSFLESLSDKDFNKYCQHQDKIINVYLDRLLEREKERQNLLMAPDEQLSIVRKITTFLISEDISTLTKNELHKQITNENIELLKKVRRRYLADTRPTIEELTNKLSMHAFFDRKGSDESLIGFVNDFIFGLFIAMCAIEDDTGEWLTNEYFVDIAVTAYMAHRKSKKEALWEKLNFMFEILPPEFQFRIDVLLKGGLVHKYCDTSFNQLRAKSINVPGEFEMENITFIDCQFTDVKFKKSYLNNIGFINCKFYNCAIEANGKESNVIELYNCQSDSPNFLSSFQSISRGTEDRTIIDYHRMVLERFWQQGRSHLKKKKPIRTLYTGIGKEHHRDIADAIEDYKKDGLLSIESDWAAINLDRITEIKEILGRQ